MTDLANLERLARTATPGPWDVDDPEGAATVIARKPGAFTFAALPTLADTLSGEAG